MITRTVGASNAPLEDDPSNHGSQLFLPADLANQVARYEMATADEIADDLKVFVEPNQVVQLTALQVHEPGLTLPVTMAGYFDFNHLRDLAAVALELSPRAKGVYFTLNPLHHDLQARITNRVMRVGQNECAKKIDVLCRRWLLIDIDPIRPSGISVTDAEKNMAIVLADEIKSDLQRLGWPDPVVGDSGNGIAILYRVDLPAEDGGLLKEVLKYLKSTHSSSGAQVDVSTHDPGRLWRIPGTLNRKGDSSPLRPHRVCRLRHIPDHFQIVTEPQLRRLAKPAIPEPLSEILNSAAPATIKRAEKYLAKIPPAIAGQGGDPTTFGVACCLVLGFDLTPFQALPLLKQWNVKCLPPWTDLELRRKLDEADKKGGERGHLNKVQRGLNNAAERQRRLATNVTENDATRHKVPEASSQGGGSEQFCLSIPDYVQVDLQSILKPFSYDSGRCPYVRTAICILAFWAMIVQRCSRVVLPDVAIAESVWGTRPWPVNWRSTLSRTLTHPTCERSGIYVCPNKCPFHGTSVPHQHYEIDIPRWLIGALEVFVVEREGDIRWYNFSPRLQGLSEDERKNIKELRKSGRLGQVHFPTLLFARSPKVSMSRSQRRLIYGMTRELTRDKRRYVTRSDHAAVVINGIVPDGNGGQTRCPLLDRDLRYVGFNGNGRRTGYGYRIVGDTLRGWLHRCGYGDEVLQGEPIKSCRRWLADLQNVSERFQLTVAAWHSRRQEWLSLLALDSLVRSHSGREWLSQCSVRIYAPEDYTLVWRRYFAARLGFCQIPGGETDPQLSISVPTSPWDRTRTLAWLNEKGLNQSELAKQLACSKTWVSQQLSGSKRWSASFAAKVQALALTQ